MHADACVEDFICVSLCSLTKGKFEAEHVFNVSENAFDAFLSLYLLKICLKMFHSSLNLNQQCMEKKEQK